MCVIFMVLEVCSWPLTVTLTLHPCYGIIFDIKLFQSLFDMLTAH